MLFCHIKFWTNNGDSSDAAARVELISSQHDKDISRVGTLFITQVTSKANPCVRPNSRHWSSRANQLFSFNLNEKVDCRLLTNLNS